MEKQPEKWRKGMTGEGYELYSFYEGGIVNKDIFNNNKNKMLVGNNAGYPRI